MSTAVVVDIELLREHARIAAVVDGHAKNGDENALFSFATKDGNSEAIRVRAGQHLISLHTAKGDDGALDGLRHIATSEDILQITRTDAGLKLIALHSSTMDIDFHAIRWLAMNDGCAPAVRDAAGAKLINFYATCNDESGRRNGLKSIADDSRFTSATRQAARNHLAAVELARQHATDVRSLEKKQPLDARSVQAVYTRQGRAG